MEYRVISCTYEKHAEVILYIFNEVIATSTALYDYHQRTLDSMAAWFETKTRHHFPVIGLESLDGKLMAFGSYGTFRQLPAYHYTVEHSIYVHSSFRGQGLGHVVLDLLVQSAQENNYHAMIGGIDADNQSSIALHKKHGFTHVGTLPQVGYKFGRWLNLAFYQRLLETPTHPTEE